MLTSRVRVSCFLASSLAACTSTGGTEIGVEPLDTPPPQVVPVEVEPARELPPIVALPLPELAPTRPLAHLAPLWRQGDGPAPTTVVALGRSPVEMPLDQARALGLPDAAVDLARFENRSLRPLAWAGPLLVLGGGTSYAGATTSSELAWLSETTMSSYTFAISPRMLIAALYEPGSDAVVAWALADGSEQWHRGADPDFARIKLLDADAEHLYLLGDAGVAVLDPDTGATRWTASTTSPECGFAFGEGKVVVEDPSGHRVFDVETGSLVARMPVLEPGYCAWMGYGEVAPGQIRDGLLFAFDVPREGVDPQLRAIELASGTQRWALAGLDTGELVVGSDAVYAARGRSLVALDVTTGRVQAEIAIGSTLVATLEPVGGAAGPLLVVVDPLGRTTILGRTEEAPVPERYQIRGQLVTSSGMDAARLAGVRIRVGDAIVKTDAKGRFKAEGEAIGVIEVGPAADPYGDDYDYELDGDQPVMIEPRRIVLEGEGKYELGKLDAWEASVA